MTINREKIEKKIIYLMILLIAAFYLLPYLLFGTNSAITIHDNLDSYIPWLKMFHDNNLFFKFNTPTKGFNEMSTLYYSHMGYTFQNILYSLFNDFTAYVLTKYFSLLFGFLSMYILLKKTIGFSRILSIFISICYAILPVTPGINIATSILPLIISIFCYFTVKKSILSWKVFLLLFYPFFSHFTIIGIFILGFWFLGLFISGIKNKNINVNLLIGFILLCIGYITIDLKLFYIMFILRTPLNRSIFPANSNSFFSQIKIFKNSFIGYSESGYYHAASLQNNIIIPLAFFISLSCLILFFHKTKEQPETKMARIKSTMAETNILVKQLFLVEFTVFIFCCIAALYDSGLFEKIIIEFIPLLHGFQWSRVWIFNRILWYVIFAYCLQLILQINLITLDFDLGRHSIVKIRIPRLLLKLSVGILIFLQIGYISTDISWNNVYNDQNLIWRNFAKTIIQKIIPNRKFAFQISYKEFFAVELFNKIKSDISYSDEKVTAFGYHPSVLMYNGFNCIDGYNNAYPLSYMQKFRTLIAPELEVNEWAREYYDTWGGRMYLFNSELGYQPTRDKNTSPVKLNIDMNVFRNDFNGMYILSRAEISNGDDLGLNLVRRYYDEESIYTIYLYQCSR